MLIEEVTPTHTIQYAIDLDTGLVFSRVDSELAVPVLDYEGMTPANGYKTTYNLQRCPVFELVGAGWASLLWTRKIAVEIKNLHREFWGMKPLKGE
jgi:hypothetical protein